MSPELDRKLVAAYPVLYKQRHLGPNETCMCWGFSCDDGWYDLLNECSAKLEELNKTLPEDSKIVAMQVKEKFGGLRFYAGGGTKEVASAMSAAIREAEKKSYETCESCGKAGKERPTSWICVLCDECYGKKA